MSIPIAAPLTAAPSQPSPPEPSPQPQPGGHTLARFGDGDALDELKAELWLRTEAVDEVRGLQ